MAVQTFHFERALLPEGWLADVRLTTADGVNFSIESDVPAGPGDARHAIALPGMPNLHSHAFQRGMAGLAEVRGESADTFWTWRQLMYRFALTMTPEDVEAVAAQLYVEMLEAGFTRVGEFHYLHHDIDGRSYANPAEMAERIAAASGAAGIGLTLLPVFYAHATFGGAAPHDGQRRFICGIDDFAALVAASRKAIAGLVGANLGVAPHSLRAVTPDELAAILPLSAGGPIHIHAAEQMREVEDCLAWSGQRPVEWLLDQMPLDARWCLIHATHMTDAETRRLAGSGAVAGLCPVTEANLGDGTFNGPEFVAAGGRFGIGSDSNVLIGVADELRQLEYAQRLAHRQRNVMSAPRRSTGRVLFEAALAGGSAALGQAAAGLRVGAPADFVTLDPEALPLAGKSVDAILDTWIFGTNRPLVDCVFTRGIKRVDKGRHLERDKVAARFTKAMAQLLE